MEELEREVTYEIVRGGQRSTRRIRLRYSPCRAIADGTSNYRVLVDTIGQLPKCLLRDVLTDLYRYLVFGNFAGVENSGTSGKLADLSEYPYCGALPEGESPDAARHISADTNAAGATLYLLLEPSRRSEPDATALVLGGVLSAMLDHPHFGKQGRPAIYEARS